MAYATYLVALAGPLTEGVPYAEGGVEPDAGAVDFLLPESSQDAAVRQAGLERFLAQCCAEPGSAVFVLPTEEITFRRLHFPFQEARKIRPVLRIELESELLEDVEEYASDQDIAPAPGSGADVYVYLARSARVRELAAACQRQGIALHAVTFSARALLATHPVTEPLAFQVYLGADEAFVSQVREGRMEAVKSVSSSLTAMLLELHNLGINSAGALRRLLSAPVVQERPDLESARSKLKAELESLAGEINLFIRIQSMGQAAAVYTYGLYAPWLEHSPATGQLSLDWSRSAPALPQRMFFGALGELVAAPDALKTRHAINFHRGGSGWTNRLKESRRPLLVGGVLLLLVLLLLTVNFGTRAVGLYRQQAEGEAAIHKIVRRYVSTDLPVSTGLAIIKERAQKARDDLKGTSRFSTYSYNALTLLTAISDAVAAGPGLAVDSLNLGPERLSMTGTTPSYQVSEALRERLAAIPQFKGKEPRLTHSRMGETTTFRITIE
jgi:hypothetical protein